MQLISLQLLVPLISIAAAKKNGGVSSMSSQAASVASSVSSVASSQISSALSQAQDAGAQATAAAGAQYDQLAALVSELVNGKEPSFTESVMSRFSAAVYTQDSYLSSISSSAASAASSASSYASSMASSLSKDNLPTALPSLDEIYARLESQMGNAVDAASIQFYGSKKGVAEQASSSASSAYEEASKTLSSYVYGTTNYADLAQSSIAAAAADAQAALSAAIYGKQPGIVDQAAGAYAHATSVVGDTVNQAVSSASSVASDASKSITSAASAISSGASAQASSLSKAVIGPEDNSYESATMRMGKAVESAQARLASFIEELGDATGEAAATARSQAQAAYASVSSVGSEVSKAASSAARSVKEEL